MKAYYCLCGALIGAGIAMLIHMSLTSILIGLAVGVFLGFIIFGVAGMRPTQLQRNFAKLGKLRGKALGEITAVVGPYSMMKRCVITDRDNARGFFFTWTQDKYSIELLFDADYICIGVTKEINPNKK